jgi:putative two-component system response regulator
VAVIVDDVAVRRQLRRTLDSAGYGVIAIADPDLGARAVHEHRPDVLVVDASREGHETCRRLRADVRLAGLPILAVTTDPSMDGYETALEAGADDFITRPISPPVLLARIRSVLRTREVLNRMEQAHAIVAALFNTVAAKDPTLKVHSRNMAHRAARLGAAVGLRADELDAVAFGALLHDIGKIAIPQSMLDKPGPLTPAELELMRRHPEYGSSICDPLRVSAAIGPIIRHHHERWDGMGYPSGLRGESIPLGSRIVSIADAYDAIVRGRPYRAPRTHDEAIAEIRRCSGSQFDPGLVPLFIDEAERLEAGAPPSVELPLAALLELDAVATVTLTESIPAL